jgi:hypothetical protein
MLQHRGYLLRRKRRLPETLNDRLFKEKIYKAHSSTCSRQRHTSRIVEGLGVYLSERTPS